MATLSIARILTDTFRVFGLAWPCFVLPFVPFSAASWWSEVWLAGSPASAGWVTGENPLTTPAAIPVYAPMLEVARVLVEVLIAGLVSGWSMLMGYNRWQGRAAAPGRALRQVARQIWPLLVIGLLYALVVGVGLLALILPGIYLAARYWVFPMAILVEGAGTGAMTRASQMSQGARFAVVAAVVIFFAIVYVGVLGLNILAGLVMGIGPGGPILSGIGWTTMVAVLTGDILAYALGAAFGVALYDALRQREAPGVRDNLAEVFA